MANTTSFHDRPVPSVDIDRSLEEISRKRTMKLTGVLVGLVLGIVALFAFTYLAYSDTPAEIPPDRIGSEAMESVGSP